MLNGENVDEPVVLGGNNVQTKPSGWFTEQVKPPGDLIKHHIMHVFTNMCMSIEIQIHCKQGDLMDVVQPPGLPCHVRKLIWWDGLTTSNGLGIHPTSELFMEIYVNHIQITQCGLKQLVVTQISTTLEGRPTGLQSTKEQARFRRKRPWNIEKKKHDFWSLFSPFKNHFNPFKPYLNTI